ncbi:MAG: hypothetical protein HQL91_12260 [Magnetococcales bacterium]|nr:hypothetical protein [Magnetococcales bacterium]
MGYTELLEHLRVLSAEQQDEVYDFVSFLSSSCPRHTGESLGWEQIRSETGETFSGPLAGLRARVARESGEVQPMSREELYDRPCFR